MDKRFPKFTERSCLLKKLRFVFEKLERRQLLANDLWSGANQKSHVSDDTSDYELFSVGSAEILVTQRTDRWVFPNADTAKLARWGLTPVRPVTSQDTVFEFTNPSSKSLRASFMRSAEYASAVPVLKFAGSNSEAVLFDEVIVSLYQSTQIKSLVARHSNITSYRPLAGTPDQYLVTLNKRKGFQTLRESESLKEDISVRWVSPNFHQSWEKSYIPNDSRFGNQWAFHNTGQGGGVADADSDLVEAWDLSNGGSNAITIGIVDDGVSLDHPDLDPWTNANEIANNGIDDDGNGWIDDIHGWNFVSNNNVSEHGNLVDWHGTAVAGVATARGDNQLGVVGAAYRSRPLSARIFEGGLVASDASIASAIYYAAGRKASGVGTWKSSDVMNLSWGGGVPSTVINTALQWSTVSGRQGKGLPIFIAAGNNAGPVSEPAAQSPNIGGVVSVGATNFLGTKSDYSNSGPSLDLVAPSDDSRPTYLSIDTTDRVGNLGFSSDDYTGIGEHGFGGTSSSTALVSGAVALALARADILGLEISPLQVEKLLENNTDIIDGNNFAYVSSTGRNDEYGYGRLNVYKLLSSLGTVELGVLSSSIELQNNQSTVSLGSAFVGDTVDIPFRIRNQGTSVLNISNIHVSGIHFSRVEGPAIGSLGLGESAHFVVRFAPTNSGNVSATITIDSNDVDESTFSFQISAFAVSPSIGGSVYEDWNGNGIKDRFDQSTLPNQVVFLDANDNGVFDSNQANTQVTNSAATPIPDLSSVAIPVQVSGLARFVTDVNVTINISHTIVSDLIVLLQSPSGKQIQLLHNAGQNSDRFTNLILDDEASSSYSIGSVPLSGAYLPDSPLWSFDGEQPNGIWNLIVTDGTVLDTGTVLNWSLTLATGEQSTRTQDNGFFHFVALPPGTHIVRHVLPLDYVASGTTSRSVLLNATELSMVNQHFGIGKPNRFYAIAYDDFNKDGVLQSTDIVLADRTIYFDENKNGQLDPVQGLLVSSGIVNLLVPDLTTRTSTISVSGSLGQVIDVDVSLNISMTFDADLIAYLIHPDGTRIELFSKVGGSRDNFTNTVLDDQSGISIKQGAAPFTGRFRPNGPLSNFNGKSANGSWSLELADVGNGEQATLLNWSLSISSKEIASSSSYSGTLFLDLPLGNQDVRMLPINGWIYTQPSDGRLSVAVSGLPLYDQQFGSTAPPQLTANNSAVHGVEGSIITNAGTWSDGDSTPSQLAFTASQGTVTKNADGTWNWTLTAIDQQSATLITIAATDAQGNVTQVTFTYDVANIPPVLTRSLANVTGNVLTTILNTGTVSDVPGDTVTMNATVGSIVDNNNGTWTWSITPSERIGQHVVTITASDEDGGVSTVEFAISALVAIRDLRAYYRESSFESLSGINAAVDASRSPLHSTNSNASTSSNNVVNYWRGINGVFLDIAGLVGTSLTTADFIFRISPNGIIGSVTPNNWPSAPPPQSINVTPGSASTPARVTIAWPNNVIQNTWLQIVVLANANTGLLERETYYLGHVLGDVNLIAPYQVTNGDLLSVQGAISNSLVSVSDSRDINKDRRVTAADLSVVQSRISSTVILNDIIVPPRGSGAEGIETLSVSTMLFCTSQDPIATVLPYSQDESRLVQEIAPTVLGPMPGPSSKSTPQSHDFRDDGSIRYNNDGLAYFFDPLDVSLVAAPPSEDNKDGGPIKNDQPANLDVPVFHSRPSVTKKIYLDFDGHSVSGTPWNNQNFTGSYNTGSVINANPFSMDSDLTTFNSTELNAISDVWSRISEDFAPFQVDVTTDFPGAAALTAGGQAIRVVFSTNFDATSGTQWYPYSGGVAYIGSWFWTVGAPVWVFTNNLSGSSKNFAEAASHEVGHSFGLSHDGRLSPTEEYYAGHGSGATGWAPIMGNGYSRSLTQWSLGEYASSNNPEDDLSVISGPLGYIPDDHGNAIGSATQLISGSNGAIASSGLITTRTDVDYFKFATQTGTISLQANPIDPSTNRGNLDIQFVLLDSIGTTVLSVNDVDQLGTSLSLQLQKGIYYVFVDGVGRVATPGHPGYSDYASIGQYTISGTVVPNQSPIANADNANTAVNQSVLIDVLANDSDPENDSLSFVSLGTPSSGTIALESGKVRFNPEVGFAGVANFVYTISDQLGAWSTGTVSVTVSNNTPPTLTVDQASVTGNEGTVLTNTGTWADIDVPVNNVVLSATIGTVTKNANGTWTWQLNLLDQSTTTQVQVTADDGVGGMTSRSFSFSAINVAPTFTLAQSAVTGNVLSTIVNNGSWNDVSSDTVSMSASIGTVSVQANGSWTWSYTSPVRLVGNTVTITASDEDGGTSQKSFLLDALVAVSDRRIWYRGSEFDSLVGVSAALDLSKTILKSTSVPTQTSFSNVTNYTRGINGIVLEVAGLVALNLTESDFVFRVAPAGANGVVTPSNWSSAPSPSAIQVVPGSANAPARVSIVWPDNAIQNTWLQIILNANANTGLVSREVYYVGHAFGEVDGESPFRISTLDVALVRAAVSNNLVESNDVRDVDKDRRITTLDVGLIRTMVSNTVLLNTITVPPEGSGGEGEGSKNVDFIQTSPRPTQSGPNHSMASSLSLENTLAENIFYRAFDEVYSQWVVEDTYLTRFGKRRR